uniref:Very-long-chain (3R)-3-hydroxyacyl-CoA dehydratase n=1 Tax=Gadus morhua TaxID=8049 RepID=A0A8C5F641_GADMO
MKMSLLTPHVYWAQRHEDIYLRVELIDTQVGSLDPPGLCSWSAVKQEYVNLTSFCLFQNMKVHMHENVLEFSGQGHGAKGQNDYQFSLAFRLPVNPEVSFKSTQRQVSITVKKAQRGWWDRLTIQEKKPLFLAPDFDRWLEESDAEMEIHEKKQKRVKMSRREENGRPSIKTIFLFLYNLVQFLCFSWIFINMTVRLFIFGQDSMYDTFHTMSDVMFFCQTLAAIEVVNAAFGVVKTGVVPTLIQVVGRNFILFIIIGSLEEMHNKAVVFFVFYPWSAIEIFRYPFYMLGCFNTEWKDLTWLRYTAWIPLYPLGALAEAVAVVQSIPLFDEANLFSIDLTKSIGVSIRFSHFLYIYLVLMVFALTVNFRHLYKQRKRRFHTNKRKAQ